MANSQPARIERRLTTMLAGEIGRREFVLLVGGAAVPWPAVAHAQQPAPPGIGYINIGPRDEYVTLRDAAAFRQ